jgi:hypothetical protein
MQVYSAFLPFFLRLVYLCFPVVLNDCFPKNDTDVLERMILSYSRCIRTHVMLFNHNRQLLSQLPLKNDLVSSKLHDQSRPKQHRSQRAK